MSISKNLTVTIPIGLHGRPAAQFVKLAQEFNGEVLISFNDKEKNGESMMGIMALGIKEGYSFDLTLNGEQEEEYMLKFEELISKDD